MKYGHGISLAAMKARAIVALRCLGGQKAGAALFIALALLALFSVLGAAYMRFMALEVDSSDMRLRWMRARHYANAGVYSAQGHIRDALFRSETPDGEHEFSYALYDMGQGRANTAPIPVSAYDAKAAVTIAAIEEALWNERFPNGPAWPGMGRAYHVVSRSRLRRAGGAGMINLATHAVEAVLIVQNDSCDVLYWGIPEDEIPSE